MTGLNSASPTTLIELNAGGVRAESVRVGAVIVTFCPEVRKIERVIEAITPQVARVLVVDNGSPPESVDQLRGLCRRFEALLVEEPVNVGIASAQNQGAKLLLAEQCDYLLLLDHDSVPSARMVTELVCEDIALRLRGEPVGAVGPVCEDFRTGARWPFVRLDGLFVRRIASSSNCPIVKTDFLIASGSLIHRTVFEFVGPMNEAYFIDHVDTEWCLRASASGYSLFGVDAARLDHELGDRIVRVWFLRWREVAVHSPVRMYYMFRNTLRMVSVTPMPWAWRIAHVYRLAQFMFFYGLLVRPRISYWRAMVYGAVDAAKKRMYGLGRSL